MPSYSCNVQFVFLDPKLTFFKQKGSIFKTFAAKIKLFKKVKSLHLNHIKINTILFKSLICLILDNSFIALSFPTQRILSDLQKLQNRILRQIKYFPPGTSTAEVHEYFKIDTISTRTHELLKKFARAKSDHDLISASMN